MIIVTRPEHDLTTKYISLWAEEIINLARKKGIKVVDLKRDKANKLELSGRIKKLSPRALFINGHGNESCVTGHDNEVLIQDGDNQDLLKGKIIYAVSCKSGDVLGRSASELKGTVYIGYKDDFVFVTDQEHNFRPLLDPKARPFMDASNQVMISLLKGNKAKEASRKSIKKFHDNCQSLLTSNADVDSLTAAQFLWWNARNQVCLGNVDETI